MSTSSRGISRACALALALLFSAACGSEAVDASEGADVAAEDTTTGGDEELGLDAEPDADTAPHDTTPDVIPDVIEADTLVTDTREDTTTDTPADTTTDTTTDALDVADTAGDADSGGDTAVDVAWDTAADSSEDAGPTICGGFAGTTCGRAEWCDFDAGCGFADGTGVCRPRPEACTEEYDPVCACDGTTYSNACFASMAGFDVHTLGVCPGAECGGLADLRCSRGEYCRWPIGICAMMDPRGTCDVIPEICTREYVPVCGCNGSTYDNACLAAQAGQNLSHAGACGG